MMNDANGMAWMMLAMGLGGLLLLLLGIAALVKYLRR